MHKENKLYRLTLTAMFAALIFVITAFLKVPMPNGYSNIGDCFVILSGLLLGPVYGAAASAIGSAFSDLFLGAVQYAPATFVIKAAMAAVTALLYRAIKKTGFRFDFITAAAVALVAEIIMLSGYFVYDIFLYGIAGAVVDVFGNTMQGIASLVSSTILYSALMKTGVVSRIKKPNE